MREYQLLVTFAARRLSKRPCLLQIEDICVPMILAFLEHIEETRGNKARSRNARLAAVKSFFRYLERSQTFYPLALMWCTT